MNNYTYYKILKIQIYIIHSNSVPIIFCDYNIFSIIVTRTQVYFILYYILHIDTS